MANSNSVRVWCSADQRPKTIAAALELLSVYGDIARLDVTLVSATGYILATYFDVRDADRVLAEYGLAAEVFPAAAHDFRAVTVPPEVAVTSLCGFQSFGEVMGVKYEGQDVVVEFFDMRAAHAVIMSLPGSNPRAGTSAVSAPPLDLPRQVSNTFSKIGLEDSLSLASFEEPLSARTGGRQEVVSPSGGRIAVTPVTSAAVDRTGKPARAKAGAKDLAKFEIQAEKIASGEDSRTTVMLRNIPKSCSREDVAQLLARCGLKDKYTFFYMPFDKRRNILCGFAFLNFVSPMDVLQLHTSTQTSLWRTLTSGQNTVPPAASYARLQGHHELVKHFSLSAVMYDTDAKKRPQFMQGKESDLKAKDNLREVRAGLADAAKVNVKNVDPNDMMQPQYIFPLSSPISKHEDLDWFESGLAGA